MASVAPNDLSSLWMPFTDNRYFKANPRLMVAAQDMHYTTAVGRRVLDGTAGLWCVNAGHGREPIVKAIQQQAAVLDYAPTFQLGHPLAFQLASRVAGIMPEGLDRIFLDAGFEWREPGCSMCLAMNADKLEFGERCASTSNRNFEGRQGRGGRTHLMSPAMAGASAIAGNLVDIRKFS